MASADFPSNVASALLATLPWGVVLLDAQGAIQHLNQQAASWSGALPEALLGQSFAALGLPAAWLPAAESIDAPHEVWLPAAGQWMSVRVTRQAAGGWVVYGQDITAQKQREQQYQALADNTPDVLMRWTPDLRLRYANPALAAKVGTPLTALLGKTKGEMGLPEEVAGPYLAALQQVFDTGQPQELHHALPTPQGVLTYHSRLVPELRDGQVETVLGIARDFTELHQSQAEALRLQGEVARQATDKFQKLFESMSEGFCVMEMVFAEDGEQVLDVYYREMNPAFVQQTGLPLTVVGQSVQKLLPGLEPFWYETYGRVARTGEPVQFDYQVAQLGRWFEVHAFRVGPPEAHQVAAIFTDIMARKQAEQRQAFLLHLSDALRPLTDPVALQRASLRLLREHLGGSRALYTEALDQAGTLRIGTEDRAPGLVPMEGLVLRFQDFTPEAWAEAQTSRPLWRTDVTRDDHTPEQQAGYAALGTRAWLMTPLVKNGHLVAELTVHSAEAREWTPAEIVLVQETTERTWAAVEQARAEEALRASEAQFRTVVNLVPDLLWRSTPVGDTTWYNQRWYEYTGQTPTEAVGYGWTDVIHPDDRAESSRRYRAAVAASQPFSQEHRIRSAQGEYRWFQVQARPLLGEHGAVTAWFGAATDIHARKLVELRLRQDAETDAFRLKLHDALRPLADPTAIQGEAARLLREQLAAGWCYYNELDETGTVATVVRDVARAGLPSFVGVHDLSGVPEYTAYLRGGKVLNAPDIMVSGLFNRPIIDRYVALGMHAALEVPLVKDGQLRAILVVADTVPRAWTAEDIMLTQEVAERTWAAVERARAEAALAASEEKYRSLFDSIDEGFCLIELLYDEKNQAVDYRFLEVNQAFEQAAGLHNVVGKRESELAPNAESYWRDTYDRVAQTGEAFRWENYSQATDRWLSAYASRVGGATSRRVALVFDDITERKQHEQRQAFMLKLSDTLRTEPTVDAVANRALAMLSDELQLDRSYITTYYVDENRADVDYQLGNNSVPPLPDHFVLSDYPDAFKSTFTNTVVIEDDFERQGLSEAEQRSSQQLGMRAMVGATLRKEDKPLWSLVAISSRPRRWTAGEIALVEEVAERTWAAIERARDAEALRESEEKYRTLFQSLDEGFAVIEFLPDGASPTPDFRFVEVNAAFERQTGHEQVVGKRGSELNPGTDGIWLDTFSEIARTGEARRFEIYHQATNRWYDVFATPVGGAESRQVCVIFADTSERRAREEQQRFLLALGDALRAEPEADAVANRAIAMLSEQLDLDRCYIASYRLDGDRADITHQVGNERVPPMPDSIRPADFPEALRITFDRTLVIDDFAQTEGLSDLDRQNIGALGLRALAAATLRQGEKVPLWVIVAVSGSPRQWTRGELALLEEVTERTWAAMERTRAETALAASETKYRTLFESMDEGFYLAEALFDADGRCVDIFYLEENPAAVHMTGQSFAGHRLSELGAYEPYWLEIFGETARTGQPQRREEYAAPDGIWYEFYVFQPAQVRENQFVLIFRDVTKRRRAQEALQASEERYRTLFETMDQGYAELELIRGSDGRATDIRYLELNPQYERLTGIPVVQALGRTVRELMPQLDEWWIQEYDRIVRSGRPEIVENEVIASGRWYEAKIYPRAGERFSVLSEEITVRKKAEATLRASEERQAFLLQLSDALRPLADPADIQHVAMQVLGQQLGVSRAQYYLADETGEYLSSAGGYTDGVPAAVGRFRLLEFGRYAYDGFHAGQTQVVADATTDPRISATVLKSYQEVGFLAYIGVPFVQRGRLLGTVAVHQSGPRQWTDTECRLVEETAERAGIAVERARAEEALRESEKKYRTLFDSIDEAFFIIEVMYNEMDEAIDYRLLEANPAFERATGIKNAVGKLGSEYSPDSERYWVETFDRVARTGEGLHFENYHAATDRWYQCYYTRNGGVGSRQVAAVFNDITERKRRELSTALLDEIGQDLAVLSAPDELMQTVGRRLGEFLALSGCYFVDVDEARNEVTVHYGWASENVPSLMQTFRLEEYLSEDFLRTMRAGEVFVLRDTAQDERADAESYARLKVGSFVTVPFLYTRRYIGHIAITTEQAHDWQPPEIQLLQEVAARVFPRIERARAEEALRRSEERYREQLEADVRARTAELKESAALLQATMDSSVDMVQVFAAVRDAVGDIVDFTWRLNNDAAEQVYGEVVGQSLLTLNPGVVEAGIFATFRQVVETGVADQRERHYVHEQFDGWFYQSAVKLGDGVATTTADITSRKTAEQERLRNLRLLEQAEAVAGLGSWDYHLLSGEFQWSDGMYHLFGMSLGQPVEPGVYLQYVVAEDRSRAEQLVVRIQAGHDHFEETLRLQVGEQVRTVRVKAAVLRDEGGQPVRVLGVDLDISELQRLEADNLRLRLGQQQALFEAVQAAQEEERRRMSESLHNGIGQILYATKLQLDRLPAEPGPSPRARAAELLSEAIRQTRALSHELTPAILEDYGLEATLRSMCSTLHTPALRWHCHFVFDEGPALPAPLQLAVYRLAQELVQNVLKHAQATDATLEVEVLPTWVVLRVEDNGQGFDPTQTSDGLGLRTLRSRTALLGGSIHVTSTPGQGTHCQVRLPLSPTLR